MAFSLSLTSLSLSPCPPPPPPHHHHGSPPKQPHTHLPFPPKSFFGSPLTAAALSPPSPLLHKPSPSATFAVYAAKGHKMKTHKASAKRFRVTGNGKIMRRRAGKQHLLGKKNTKRKKRLSKMVQVNKSDYNNVMGALPYLKANKKAI